MCKTSQIFVLVHILSAMESNDVIPVILESPPLEATQTNPQIAVEQTSSHLISIDNSIAMEHPIHDTATNPSSDMKDTSKSGTLSSIKKQCIEGNAKIKSKTLLNIPPNSALNSLKVRQLPYGSSTGNPRNKTALRPGYSLMDWIRLTKTPGKDLSGRGGRYIDVTPTELKKHSNRKDAWMSINGLVFNVTGNMC